MPQVVIPDDAPPVMSASKAYRTLLDRLPVTYCDTLPGSEDELIRRIQPADIVINIRASSRFTRNVFEQCRQLRLLSLWGTGTDNVDLPAAAHHGITVTNTPGVSALSIGEHCLALLLSVARGIPRTDSKMREGQWPKGQGTQMHGKTLGIIGLGAIGRRFAQLGAAIGMRVLTWTMRPKPELGFESVPLETLLRESDVVSVHLRLSNKSRGMIDEAQFEFMKPTAILINTARGPIVSEPALIRALETGRIAGAGLDVFDVEPLPVEHPLRRLPNVVLTAHSAGVTPEALEAGLQMAVDNVFHFLNGATAHAV